jgi:hypothetical protein
MYCKRKNIHSLKKYNVMKKYFVSFVLEVGLSCVHQTFGNAIVEFKDIKTSEDLDAFQETLLQERKKQPNRGIISLCILYYREI